MKNFLILSLAGAALLTACGTQGSKSSSKDEEDDPVKIISMGGAPPAATGGTTSSGTGGKTSASGGTGGGTGGTIVESDCFENPTTHFEIINACTTATRVKKTPTLTGLNGDGSLPTP